MEKTKIINLAEAKAKAAGVSTGLVDVIDQLNERFGIRIDITDERLARFNRLYAALDEAAMQHHEYQLEEHDSAMQSIFNQGVEVGRAQMMTDVIICVLEQDGLLKRS
ncbi:hypothetical protein BGP77_00010 [Saccharospirillum sp. MSK14-1]|uniref:hypothetical protein n=1 Tax=Saccharospirillum sp. MSK14-1 TaxID=1897632 RepID=UPI000D3A7248|nr:hypothetical protein [Saccharospirillum sp. MSK14-1]PTY38545.1 hypothetical protein BGP77_00010 [Saccharospirillum sp. MSK14-1]